MVSQYLDLHSQGLSPGFFDFKYFLKFIPMSTNLFKFNLIFMKLFSVISYSSIFLSFSIAFFTDKDNSLSFSKFLYFTRLFIWKS